MCNHAQTKAIGYPKNTKPKVSQAKVLIQKVIPGKGKATTTKTFVTTVQVYNNGGSARNIRAQQPVLSEIETQVNEAVGEILQQVTNQNDDLEEIEELEQEEDDCNAAFEDAYESDEEEEQDQ